VGHYAFSTPYLLILDLELAKSIMIKDFDHFTDRRAMNGLNVENPVNKLHMSMLPMLKGEKWKMIRNAYSPIFTSGKLKVMTSVMNKVNFYCNLAALNKYSLSYISDIYRDKIYCKK